MVIQFSMAEVNITCSLYRSRLLVGVKDTLLEDVALALDAIPVALNCLDRPKSSVSFVATRSQVKASRWAEKADCVARGKVNLSDVHVVTELVAGEAVNSRSRTTNVSLGCNKESGTTPDRLSTADESSHEVNGSGEDSSLVDDTNRSEYRDSEVHLSVHSDQAVEDAVPLTGAGSHSDFKKPDAVIDIQDINSEILQQLQASDPSLKKVSRLAVYSDKVKSKSVAFSRQNELCYRKWTPRNQVQQDFKVTQVVVPRGCRNSILKLAHDIPIAGQLGMKKTKDRILQNFYWPGIFQDVADYCRSCPECQKVAVKRKGEVAKLGKMPIIAEPVKRIGMDIIGKLNRSSRGNAYILTIQRPLLYSV